MNVPQSKYDVIIAGGGAAGVAAAISSARNGARTLLVERDPFPGGDLISGLPILGCCNSRGEWIVGGVLDELIEGCTALGGYVGRVFDWRTLWGVCVDPEVMRLVIVDALNRQGVDLLLGGEICDVSVNEERIAALTIAGGGREARLEADFIVDCTGDAAVAFMAGVECEKGGPGGRFQPVSLVFRMGPVDFEALLDFVRDHPDEVLLSENPVIEGSPAQCARALHDAGYPYLALAAKGSLLGEAIEAGEMYPCTAIFMSPVSMSRHEITLNSTRLPDIDATDGRALSAALPVLVEQVRTCLHFARERVPGFSHATLTGVSPRIGVRETRRVVGEHVLSTEQVVAGAKAADVIAKGGHHVDIHGSGTDQTRIPVEDGRSYDIPWGCLLPRSLQNVLAAGRCLSSTREANGSARVMGTCLATGQAAGTAAALCTERGHSDARDLPLDLLQETLRDQGAVLEGTH